VRKKSFAVERMIICFLFSSAVALYSQQADDPNLQITTRERLSTESWWPTMSSLPLDAFVGSDSCVRCHAGEAAHRQSTAMSRAASPARSAVFMKSASASSVSIGSLHYTLAATGEGLDYSVSEGNRSLSRKLDWVMGAGDLGLTFLYQSGGHWYQSRTTFYLDQSKLDITTGLENYSKTDLSSALGQELTPDETRRCFNCHSVHATTSGGFNPSRAEPGLGCEACHGPGRRHVDAMAAAGDGQGHAAKLENAETADIFNPAKLSPAASIDLCGACHRSSADVTFSTNQTGSSAVVRFQPYRLEESACWRATQDARLTCTACHDPHRPLSRDPVSYDKQCLQCHSVPSSTAKPVLSARVCPRATNRCVSCHMPKVKVASMHGEFTDHFIRISKSDEEFPR
jgi:predicted CXXCH cytochrome family protein